ncbi:MAG TPA: aldehyde ferredoxin oxidoreductase C-terminal domain-containing protein [Symbiobacteriaceae bacterium]|nr:aldehyde ferredoxin oxidoreductase C-terminal domain-containing protein [Symbiobacteriaceae bacterium]
MATGYHNRLLRVNLTTRENREEPLEDGDLRRFIGGVGLGAWLLYREGSTAEPLHADNPLIFTTGPMNGTGAPGSGGYCVVTRSPLTGGFTAAQASGTFGRRLKLAGYDAVILTGRASDPVLLVITDEGIRFEDAADLKGMDTWDTETRLTERFGRNMGVACIGPGGENLVRFAAICSDHGHIAASGGVGAVMGAKNVKALVAGGAAKLAIHAPDRLTAQLAAWRDSAGTCPDGRRYSSVGTAGDFEVRQLLGTLPTRNLTVSPESGFEAYGGKSMREKYKDKKRARCYGCPIDHLHTFSIKEGPYAGNTVEEADYEDLAAWGSNVGIDKTDASLWLNNLNDRLGLDTKEGTFTISLAIECFEKGLLSTADTDGLELSWGNPDQVAELLRRTAHRQGFGDVLAEGVVRTAQHIGGDAADRAVYLTKGCAPHVHDVRNLWETLFSQVISTSQSFESIHLHRSADPEFGVMEGPGYTDGPAIARAVAAMTTKRQITDSLVTCNFLCRGSMGPIIEALNAATGWDMDLHEAITTGRRIITLCRIYNNSLGFTAAHDDISPRIAEPPAGGVAKGISIKPVLAEMRRIYYGEMGWDPERGEPLPETLRALALV